MAPERRNQLVLLISLLAALAVVIYYQWSGPSATAGQTSNERGGGARSARAAPAGPQAPDVHLPALNAERPKPIAGERNLFRFRQKPLPPPPVIAPPPSSDRTTLTVPAVPPIGLRFMGTIEGSGRRKIAALVDEKGNAIHCFEGQVDCEGRYRIWRIGAESIEISYLDGSGRQTIPKIR